MRRFTISRAAACCLAVVWIAGATTAIDGQTTGRGTIKGHVKLLGKLPGNLVIRMGMDPKCAEANRGTRVVQETVAAALDGSLANVFIHLDGKFPEAPVPTTPVVVDQRN